MEAFVNYQEKKIMKIENEEKSYVKDIVIKETPITIFLNDREIVTLLCMPQYIEDLALGFLLSEGLIKSGGEVTIDYQKKIANVKAEESKFIKDTYLKRYITTGCGKGTSFYHFNQTMQKKISSELQVKSSELLQLIREMHNLSENYKLTGCVHIAALAINDKILIAREDIGRHNAVDKIVGHCYQNSIVLKDKILLTSGRLSSEIVLKVAKMEIPILASPSAPSDLAVDLAEELGLTLIGFLRGRRMNVYSHCERII